MVHLWTFRDGMPWRCEVFFSEAEALEVAGLQEQAMSQENVEIVREVWDAYRVATTIASQGSTTPT